MRIKLVISYDGSKFYGFQRQNNLVSVQKELENTLSNIYNEDIVVKGAGRTDKGVHAKYQVVHFDTLKNISNLKRLLNNNLKDIKVKKIKYVNNDFHARHSVKEKIYLYKIDLSNKRNGNYYLLMKYNLDIKKMKEASKLFIGTHDYKCFVAGFRDDYVSTINNIKIYKFNNVLYLKFIGIGFYRYMVRNMVGALIAIGKNKASYNDILNMLNNPNCEKRLPTASPNGLYLVKIKY